MGYRHYMYLVEKDLVINIRKANNIQELIEAVKNKVEIDNAESEEDVYIPLYKLGTTFYEFGKLYYEDTDEQIQSSGTPLFSNEDLKKRYEEDCPYIVGKEAVIKAIELYKQKVISYYESLLKPNNELMLFGIPIGEKEITVEQKLKDDVEEKIREWKRNYIFDLDLKNNNITNSWKYEYALFNLVHKLKTTDFEKYDILFMGW